MPDDHDEDDFRIAAASVPFIDATARPVYLDADGRQFVIDDDGPAAFFTVY